MSVVGERAKLYWSVRVTEELKVAGLDAAARAGMDESVFIREAMTALMRSGLSLPQLVDLLRVATSMESPLVTAPRTNGSREQVVFRGMVSRGRSTVLTGKCLCPMHLREEYPTFDRCTNCGTEYR